MTPLFTSKCSKTGLNLLNVGGEIQENQMKHPWDTEQEIIMNEETERREPGTSENLAAVWLSLHLFPPASCPGSPAGQAPSLSTCSQGPGISVLTAEALAPPTLIQASGREGGLRH